jgi:hypothetical protein
MELAILLSLAASFCTATSSICQRLGARHLESSGHQVRGFDAWLVFRLARQPVWLLGFAAMLAGFLLQVSALHFGPLALVQPILTSHAMAAGPLAASQPGFTLGDPLTAILLGAFMFSERLQTTPAALAAALLGLVVLAAGVWILSRSHLITAHAAPRPAGTSGRLAERELTRRSWQ